MGIVHHPNVVTDGLVACWDAANRRSYPATGTVWSDMVGGHDGVMTNGLTFSEDNMGIINFDGTDESVVIPDSDAFDWSTDGPFSISVWFKANSTNNAMYLTLWHHHFWPYGTSVLISTVNEGWSENRQLLIYVGSTYKYGTTALNDNAWHNVVLTRASDGAYAVYVDAVAENSGTGLTGNTTTPADAEFGRSLNNYYLTGSIGCEMVYNIALTAEEVLQNYNATKRKFIGTESDNLVSFWDAGDKRSYPKTYSVLGSLWENLSYRGSAQYDGDIFLLNDSAYGSIPAADGRSITFDGTDAYGSWVSDSLYDFADKKFSFICWVKPATGNAQYDGVWGRPSTTAGWAAGYGLYFEDATTLHFWAGSYSANYAEKSVTENEWHHVAGTVSPTEVLLYVNGSVSTDGNAAGTVNTNLGGLGIGMLGSTTYAGASDIASLALYNRTLSAAEVVKHYNQTKGRFT